MRTSTLVTVIAIFLFVVVIKKFLVDRDLLLRPQYVLGGRDIDRHRRQHTGRC